jgi:hypothetical protein
MAKHRTALDVARHYAAGGKIDTPFYARSGAKSIERAGMINSSVAGRTDRLPMGVKQGSYVVPADVVSGIGQGNSMAGANALNKLFKVGPYGAAMPAIKMPTGGMMRGMRGGRPFADGGEVNEPTEIVAAGGEYLLEPEHVAEIGGGDVARGHDILDAFVKHIRSKTIKTLRKLPGPKSR